MTYDVIVAGGGPVGLFLACELRLADLSVLVLERSADPGSPLKQAPFGLRGLWTPTIEALDRRGLLDAVAETGTAPETGSAPETGTVPETGSAPETGPGPSAAEQRRWSGGHFAGLLIDGGAVDPADWPYRLTGPGGHQLGVEMAHLEDVLAGRALALGAEIRRGAGVDGFTEGAGEVVVDTGGERFHTRWLVGCDGGRSTVRRVGGFGFAGTAPAFTGYTVRADLADPGVLGLAPGHRFFPFAEGPEGLYTQWQPGAFAVVDFDGGAFHRTRPITREHVQAVLRRVSGTEVTVNRLHFASTWTDHARQATTYRAGRVLLAGDAAHVHSPLGGKGLGLGFGDALNLGWKLAATIRGDAPAGLLDTYTAERHPVGASVLDWTRAQVALMPPGARALRAVVGDLMATRDGATLLAERLWGTTFRYDLGGTHPLTGRSCPDFAFADGTRTGTLLRAGRGLLLDFAPGAPWRALDGRWGDRVRYVPGPPKDRLGLSAVLVRPDGVVAWASDSTTPDTTALDTATPDTTAPAGTAFGEAAAAASPWFAS